MEDPTVLTPTRLRIPSSSLVYLFVWLLACLFVVVAPVVVIVIVIVIVLVILFLCVIMAAARGLVESAPPSSCAWLVHAKRHQKNCPRNRLTNNLRPGVTWDGRSLSPPVLTRGARSPLSLESGALLQPRGPRLPCLMSSWRTWAQLRWGLCGAALPTETALTHRSA